jgi:sec-independent protein translocase protein TatC
MVEDYEVKTCQAGRRKRSPGRRRRRGYGEQNRKEKATVRCLEELRKRLIVVIGIDGVFIAYFFKEGLFKLLVLPLKEVMPEGDRLIFTNLPEMFMTYLKVSVIAGILAATPVIFYELWMFIAPGLYQHEQRFVIPFVICSSFLFTAGALFGYFIVFPFGFKFLMGYTNEYVQALPSVKEYFSFSTKLLFAFGLVFEMPWSCFSCPKWGWSPRRP